MCRGNEIPIKDHGIKRTNYSSIKGLTRTTNISHYNRYVTHESIHKIRSVRPKNTRTGSLPVDL